MSKKADEFLSWDNFLIWTNETALAPISGTDANLAITWPTVRIIVSTDQDCYCGWAGSATDFLTDADSQILKADLLYEFNVPWGYATPHFHARFKSANPKIRITTLDYKPFQTVTS